MYDLYFSKSHNTSQAILLKTSISFLITSPDPRTLLILERELLESRPPLAGAAVSRVTSSRDPQGLSTYIVHVPSQDTPQNCDVWTQKELESLEDSDLNAIIHQWKEVGLTFGSDVGDMPGNYADKETDFQNWCQTYQHMSRDDANDAFWEGWARYSKIFNLLGRPKRIPQSIKDEYIERKRRSSEERFSFERWYVDGVMAWNWGTSNHFDYFLCTQTERIADDADVHSSPSSENGFESDNMEDT